MKLSKVQLEVIRLMKEGWELGRSSGFRPSWWLQKNGLGKGGETKRIMNFSTCLKLYDLGLIYKPSPKLEFPTEHWALTDKGKEVLKKSLLT